MTKHKWHDEIVAFANGIEIEVRDIRSDWLVVPNPQWLEDGDIEYRIKPQPKEPKYLYVYIFNGTAMLTETHSGAANGGRYIGKLEVEDD